MTAYQDSAPAAEGAVQYAGFWARFGALLIDSLLLGIVGAILGTIIGVVLGTAGATETAIRNLSSLLGFLLGIAYYVGMESSTRQATFGKLALGLKVTDMAGARITMGTAAIRYVGRFLSALILFIGFIMVAFTPRKQALHDMIAKTLVVKQPKP
ncbi:MAG TPA: RDD family protein [Actinomycetota bacterium]|nr:RDD family protein [Actinomycetota bacterium]